MDKTAELKDFSKYLTFGCAEEYTFWLCRRITELYFLGISRQVGTILASPVSPGCVLHKTTNRKSQTVALMWLVRLER